MSHNIYENRMFCVGEAWHRVGTRVDTEVTSKQAMELAHLDYEMKLSPLYVKENGVEIKSDNFGVLNTSNNKVVGTVTERYKIVQNIEAFDFFDNIVKSDEAFYHSAGALGNGERIWLLAKLPKNIMIFKDIDVVEKYLLLVNNHDGNASLQVYFTPVRVVCQNTLIASMKQKENAISIKHTGDINSKMKEARIALGFALDFYKTFEEDGLKMVNTSLSLDNAEIYFNKVLKIDEEKNELTTQLTNTRQTLLSLFRNGKGNNIDGIKDTVWAGYNAVTEYSDFHKTFRGNRTESILFGSSAELKKRAYKEALALI